MEGRGQKSWVGEAEIQSRKGTQSVVAVALKMEGGRQPKCSWSLEAGRSPQVTTVLNPTTATAEFCQHSSEQGNKSPRASGNTDFKPSGTHARPQPTGLFDNKLVVLW